MYINVRLVALEKLIALVQAQEQEVMARMQMHFQQEILYAHALAQEERQRSKDLMSQVSFCMSPARIHLVLTANALHIV